MLGGNFINQIIQPKCTVILHQNKFWQTFLKRSCNQNITIQYTEIYVVEVNSILKNKSIHKTYSILLNINKIYRSCIYIENKYNKNVDVMYNYKISLYTVPDYN